MHIEKIGHYVTRAGTDDEVYELRGSHCAGFVWTSPGERRTAIWRTEHGTTMNGMADMDLVEYVSPFDMPTIR